MDRPVAVPPVSVVGVVKGPTHLPMHGMGDAQHASVHTKAVLGSGYNRHLLRGSCKGAAPAKDACG